MKKIYFLFYFFFPLLLFSQSPGDIAQNFGAYTVFDDYINKIELQNDGKILVGGNFNMYAGAFERNIIRLNPDGSKDITFNSGNGFDNLIRTIKQQTDGKILVGGDFTWYNGVTANRIIRLNPDGSKDTSFNTGTGFNNYISTIQQQTDGKILVGGQFTSYNGVTENRIIRLNTDGSKDTSFNTGTGFNDSVLTIQQQTDGKILVGGGFTSYNGLAERRIIRLNADGSKDITFNIGTGFTNVVRSIQQQTDGKILVGGSFTSYNGVPENRIIRLNVDGSKDITFNSGTGFNNYISTIQQQTDGKILVGGFFTSYNGATENRIIRLNTDGSKDITLNSGTGFNSLINTIQQQTDGKILVGGLFTSYNGVTEHYIIRLNTNSSKDSSFNTGTATGFNNIVRAIQEQSEGKILVGGYFTSYKGIPENRIIRLNADGSKDTSFITGTGFDDIVLTIQKQTDGKILVGGGFYSYNGVAANRIIRLNADGSKDTSFNTGTGFNGDVWPIQQQTDGKILVGGGFTSYNGVAESYIIRLNADGSKDPTFNTGTGFIMPSGFIVYGIHQQIDGKILVGGGFTSYNGVPEKCIIRLNADGSKDTSFNTGTGFNYAVFTIQQQTDGKILVGGGFTSYNGATANQIIRLNTDGSKDTSFNTGTGFNDNSVSTLQQQTDGKILVGGLFTSYNGVTENKIIRLNLDGSKDTSFNTGTGFNVNFAWVITIQQQTDGKILVGGLFTSYNGDESTSLIGLHSEQSLNAPGFHKDPSILLYPNPVQDVLQIDSENLSNLKNVKIYDLQGKLVIENGSNSINVSNLSKGLYLAKVETDEGTFNKKFFKE